jgi:hypothetical protein
VWLIGVGRTLNEMEKVRRRVDLQLVKKKKEKEENSGARTPIWDEDDVMTDRPHSYFQKIESKHS